MTSRLNRLKIDYEMLRELEVVSRFVTIHQTEGDPPEKYVLHLTCKGIEEISEDKKPIFSETFYLGIHLHDEYPQKGPMLQMLTDVSSVFHPNIAANGLVDLGDEGDHGWFSTMGLDDVVIRIVKMIRYEIFDLDSPLNLVSANWASENLQLFPLDASPIAEEIEKKPYEKSNWLSKNSLAATPKLS